MRRVAPIALSALLFMGLAGASIVGAEQTEQSVTTLTPPAEQRIEVLHPQAEQHVEALDSDGVQRVSGNATDGAMSRGAKAVGKVAVTILGTAVACAGMLAALLFI